MYEDIFAVLRETDAASTLPNHTVMKSAVVGVLSLEENTRLSRQQTVTCARQLVS